MEVISTSSDCERPQSLRRAKAKGIEHGSQWGDCWAATAMTATTRGTVRTVQKVEFQPGGHLFCVDTFGVFGVPSLTPNDT